MVLRKLFKDAVISVCYSYFFGSKRKKNEKSIIKFWVTIFKDQHNEFYQNVFLLIQINGMNQ